MCRNEELNAFPNKAIGREVKALHIYCTNKEKGCKWQGELNDINNHLGVSGHGYQFEEVKCPNECGKMIERRYLASHVETECSRRKVYCQYCHDIGEHQFIKGQHKEECPKLPLPCPNKCEVENILREDIEAHRKQCPLEMIQCEYYSVGCKRIKLACKDQDEHNQQNMKEHLMMTKNEIISTKTQLNDTKAQLDDTKAQLNDTKAQLSDTKVQLDKALKQINGLTVLMNARLHPITCSTSLRSTQLDIMATMFNFVCPVTIKISEFNEKKESKMKWYSDSFYTHTKGYKMCLRIYTNGSEACAYLSVHLCLMKGSHDDELRWPLREEFEIKLLNQISDHQHRLVQWNYDNAGSAADRVTVVGDRGACYGEKYFIANYDLDRVTSTCQYLKDDCLFFQVTKY